MFTLFEGGLSFGDCSVNKQRERVLQRKTRLEVNAQAYKPASCI